MNKNWSLDLDSIPSLDEEAQKNLETYKKKKKEKDYSYSKHHANRVYLGETNMNSEFRPYLLLNGRSYHYNIGEISNCHHYCFSYYMAKYILELSDQQIDLINKIALSIKDSQIDELTPLVVHIVDEKEGLKHLERLPQELSFDERREINNIIINHRSTVVFMILAISGKIYDVLAKVRGTSRSNFKNPFNKVFNYTFEMLENGSSIVHFVRSVFPEIFDEVRAINKNSNSMYSKTMGRMESKLMIDHVSKDLLDEGINFINYHDGILCKSENVDHVLNLIRAHSKDLYHFTAPTKCEMVERVNGSYNERIKSKKKKSLQAVG